MQTPQCVCDCSMMVTALLRSQASAAPPAIWCGCCLCNETARLEVRCAERRGLALLPGIGFVSASHDHTLRVWDAGGALLAELVGHTALVYRAAAAAGGLVASASEDCTVRLWAADGACLQTLAHPGARPFARGAGRRRGRLPMSAAFKVGSRVQLTCHQ